MKTRAPQQNPLHATNADVARIFLRSMLKWKWLGIIIFLSVTGTAVIGTVAPFYLKKLR